MVLGRGRFVECAKVNGRGRYKIVTVGEDGKYVKELSAAIRRAEGSSHHRQCKGKKLSLRFMNLRTKIFRAATPVTVLQFEIMLYESQQLTLYLYIL